MKRAPDCRKSARHRKFFSKQTRLRNEAEICCITNKGKTAKNELENDNSDFLGASYSVYKKLGQFFFHTWPFNLIKQRYINSVKSYKYLNKLIS